MCRVMLARRDQDVCTPCTIRVCIGGVRVCHYIYIDVGNRNGQSAVLFSFAAEDQATHDENRLQVEKLRDHVFKLVVYSYGYMRYVHQFAPD